MNCEAGFPLRTAGSNLICCAAFIADSVSPWPRGLIGKIFLTVPSAASTSRKRTSPFAFSARASSVYSAAGESTIRADFCISLAPVLRIRRIQPEYLFDCMRRGEEALGQIILPLAHLPLVFGCVLRAARRRIDHFLDPGILRIEFDLQLISGRLG